MKSFKIKRPRKKGLSVIGIDPSLTGTAICTMDAEGCDLFHFETTPAPTCRGRLMRYQSIVDVIVARVKRIYRRSLHLEEPLVLIEGYSYMSKGRGQLDRTECGGIIRHQLWQECGIHVVEVPPTQLKKFITGKGNGDKTLVIAEIAKRYKVVYKTDDEYDAFALAKLASCVVGLDKPRNAAQKVIVAAVGKAWRMEKTI